MDSETSPNMLMVAAIAGFTAVALGAFGAHGLKNTLSPQMMDVYQTGVLYHLVHAAVLLTLAAVLTQTYQPALLYAAYCMMAGIILFSGSLYALAITGLSYLGIITPIGGLTWLAGWILIFVAGWRWPSSPF